MSPHPIPRRGWRACVLLSLSLFLIPTPQAYGQTPPSPLPAPPSIDRWGRDHLAWPEAQRGWADKTSTGLVVLAQILPCLTPDPPQSRTQCLIAQGKRVGFMTAAAELTKRSIARVRPDRSDDMSFFSEHTALACAATATKKTWPICAAVAYLRLAAKKHWLTDVLTGAGLGTVTFQFTWR